MEQKKDDSCSIQKSSFKFSLTLFYFHSTFMGAVHIWAFLFILWLLNYSSMIIVIWFLIFSYFRYYLWSIKWYEVWIIEWIHSWFEAWLLNTKLDLLKFLLKYKNKRYDEPEKATINILTLSLDNKFSSFNDLWKDENNKDILDFELNRIISRENEYYYDMWFKK